MATIKSYTSLEQSKKLAEILPLETADMFLAMNGILPVMSKYIDSGFVTADETAIPCWSLAALLNVLPKDEGIDCSISFGYYNCKGEYIKKWLCAFEKEGETTDDFIIETIDGSNPIDACVAMIESLHELNLL